MIYHHLAKFILIVLITLVILPIAYIMMRKLLAKRYSLNEIDVSI